MNICKSTHECEFKQKVYNDKPTSLLDRTIKLYVAQGMTTKEMATTLNERGIKTSRGLDWSMENLRGYLVRKGLLSSVEQDKMLEQTGRREKAIEFIKENKKHSYMYIVELLNEKGIFTPRNMLWNYDNFYLFIIRHGLQKKGAK